MKVKLNYVSSFMFQYFPRLFLYFPLGAELKPETQEKPTPKLTHNGRE